MPAIAAAVAATFVAEAVSTYVVGTLLAEAVLGAVITGTVASAIGWVAGAVVGNIAGGLIRNALTPSSSAPGGSSGTFEGLARGAIVNSQSGVEPIPVVYGRRKKVPGVPVCPWMSYGDTNQYLVRVFAFSEGEISAINTVYLDDVASTDARFAGLVHLVKYVGTDTQTADASLITAFPGVWTTDHRLRGVAYLWVRLQWDQDAWSGAPTVSADVDGRLLEDPRLGSPTQTAFSSNPALAIRDYLTNTRYGRGYTSDKIDDASFIAAANYCDELVSVPAAGSPSTATQARYTCDGVVNVDNMMLDNLLDLLTSCRGWLNRSGGRWKLMIDKPETPASDFEFNEDNITGAWQIKKPGRAEKLNRIRCRIFNEARDFQPDVALWDSSAFRTQDGGILLDREVSLPFTKNLYRAQQIGQIEVKQSREALMCQFRATVAGLRCEIGDVVPITHSSPGWDEKPFRILNLKLRGDDEVEVTAREYQAAVYDADDLALEETVPDTNLPDPFVDLDIADLTATSGTDDLLLNGDGTVVPRVRLRWTQPSNPFVKEYEIQMDRGSVSPTEWTDCPKVVAPAVEGFALPVKDGETVNLRIRAVTTLGNGGAWAYVYAHTVVGKTEAPSDVTGATAVQQGTLVIFDCDVITDADLDAIEIRLAAPGTTDWDNATVIAYILRGSTSSSAAAPPGDWAFLFRALDTSGNYSDGTAVFELTVTASGYAEIVAQQEDPNWMGGWGLPSDYGVLLSDGGSPTVEQYITVADDTDLDPGTGDFSIVCRIVPTNAALSSQSLMKKGTGFVLTLSANNISVSVVAASGFSSLVTTSGVMTTGDEQHVVLSFRRGGTSTVYRNAVSIGTFTSGTLSGALQTAGNNLLIGHGTPGGSSQFYGSVDDTAYYNRALTAAEVEELYNGNDVNSGLRMRHRYSEGSGTAVADDSGYGNDGTIVGGATWQVQDTVDAASGFVMHWTRVLIPESTKLASEHTNEELFEQFVPYPERYCFWPAAEIDKNIDASARVWSAISTRVGRDDDGPQPVPYFQLDYRLDAGEYDGFETWTTGVATFRYAKGRIFLDTDLGKPVITGFTVTVDAEARTETFASQSIGSSGTAIAFAEEFHSVPVIQMTPVGATALIPSAESPTTTGFTAHLYNTAGAGAAGVANIDVTGV